MSFSNRPKHLLASNRRPELVARAQGTLGRAPMHTGEFDGTLEHHEEAATMNSTQQHCLRSPQRFANAHAVFQRLASERSNEHLRIDAVRGRAASGRWLGDDRGHRMRYCAARAVG